MIANLTNENPNNRMTARNLLEHDFFKLSDIFITSFKN